MAAAARRKAGSKLGRAQLLRRFKSIRLLSLDVDGVLTDGGLYYDDHGGVSRRFHVRDGVGIKRVIAAGIEVVFISAGTTASIRYRGEMLGVPHVFIGVKDKLAAVATLCRILKIDLDQVAHVGDDVNDLPLLKAVGCPLTVAGGIPEVRALACFITRCDGGHGAVREICDLLVEAREKG
jgi:3-deoxy-D-manno-octulosonate 8-phosphate phosphatase (KDO 8-P phosphatase)